MVPQKIGRYEIRSELGRGGMATVYRAYDPSFDREVAIKVLPKEFLHDPNFHNRFMREIKIIAALEHPAIVPVYDVGEEDGVPYFVMRYMSGGSLTNQIEKGIFSMQDAARIIEKLASALAYAHKKGIIHRDIKPDNILFDSNGDPYVSDFGVASVATGTTNLTGSSAIGTPAYMSPEQAQGDKVDGRSDIYGLGAIIYQMLSGQQPYRADTPMGVAVKQITDPVPEILKANPDLPGEADTIIKTAMAKKKEDRYPTAIELARALHQVADGQTAPGTGKIPAPQSAASQPGSPEAAMSPVGSQPVSSRPGQSTLSSSAKRHVTGIGILVGILAVLAVIALVVFSLKDKLFTGQPAATETTGITETTQRGTLETTQPAEDETAQAEVNADTYVEDFNGNLDNWDYFTAGGQEIQVKSTIENGFLDFVINGKELHHYLYYTPRTYKDVRIDLRVENRSEFNNVVTMFCRYNEDNGWYEFNINSGGLYQILYTSWNKDKKNTSSSIIANGGSGLIHIGEVVNEYSAICSDRALSLSINGTEVRLEVDNNFLLEDGYAGIGVASEKIVPIEMGIDSVSIGPP